MHDESRWNKFAPTLAQQVSNFFPKKLQSLAPVFIYQKYTIGEIGGCVSGVVYGKTGTSTLV